MARQRGETWTMEETVDFLHFFGNVQKQLNSSHRNQAIYEELAQKMNDRGYNRTPHQLRIKAKDLRRQYRNIKEKGQPGKGDFIWRFYDLLDSILCNGHNTESVTTTSSTTTSSPTTSSTLSAEEKEYLEGMNGASPLDSDQSLRYKLPDCHSQAPRRFSNAPLDASAGGPSTTRALPRRRPHANRAAGLVKARTKKSPAMKAFTKAFLLQYNKNMKSFQQLYQAQIEMQRQEREKLRRQALRSKKEIKAAASQMREAILVHAAAVNRVADAMQTYNALFQDFLSKQGPQMGKT